MAIVSTSWGGDEPVVVLPWLTAGLFAVGVPLIAGAVAAVSTSAKPASGSIVARPE